MNIKPGDRVFLRPEMDEDDDLALAEIDTECVIVSTDDGVLRYIELTNVWISTPCETNVARVTLFEAHEAELFPTQREAIAAEIAWFHDMGTKYVAFAKAARQALEEMP